MNWLEYSNKDAIRNQELSPELLKALSFIPEMGLAMDVYSGGQDAEGPHRTGSHRHDHGGAADVRFMKDGELLNFNDPDHRGIFEEIVERGKAGGITGMGAGADYMGENSMHLGFGAPSVWGADGKGENAPDWLRSAYGAPSHPGTVAEKARANSVGAQQDYKDLPFGIASKAQAGLADKMGGKRMAGMGAGLMDLSRMLIEEEGMF